MTVFCVYLVNDGKGKVNKIPSISDIESPSSHNADFDHEIGRNIFIQQNIMKPNNQQIDIDDSSDDSNGMYNVVKIERTKGTNNHNKQQSLLSVGGRITCEGSQEKQVTNDQDVTVEGGHMI